MKIKPRSSFNKIIIIDLVLLCGLLAIVSAILLSSKTTAPSRMSSKSEIRKPIHQPIRLIASGDELPHDTVNLNAKAATGYNYKPFFNEIKPVFDKSDLRFCSQEVPSGALSDKDVSGYPAFNAPKEFARDLNAVGCNIINVATNHANDQGQSGIDATLNAWEDLSILAIAGANRSAQEQQKVRYFKIEGIQFAFLAYSLESNNNNLTNYGINMVDEMLISKQLAEAKQKGAYTIVSMHWGTENSPDIDDGQEKWSSFLAEHNADLVLGTGPHIIQPVKKLTRQDGGETLVWYSLGNMLNTQLEVQSLIGGFAIMNFEIRNNKPIIKSISFLPTYMHYEWTFEQKMNEDLLARKKLKIYFLDRAVTLLPKSHSTTVDEQKERLKNALNKYIPVSMVNSTDF